MADDLTHDQITLLYHIGEHDLLALAGDKRRDLEWLLCEGFVAQTTDGQDALQLTEKGVAFLGRRGAGLSEA